MKNVERYDFFELKVTGNNEPQAIFTCGGNKKIITGFRMGEDEYGIRFMPDAVGLWQYCVKSGDTEITGDFNCVANTGNNHGPVVAKGTSFRYTDDTPYVPMGTTCYAWIHQTLELVKETLVTLESSPFNKIRMCIFPKHMPFNQNDPLFYPFEKNADNAWDVNKPNEEFWTHLESNIGKLRDLGIEADLILFHPYDRWGLSELSTAECLAYLDYCIRRLSAYRNVWWSLANEYDLLPARNMADWDAFGEKMSKDDPYHHLLSVHHCLAIYPKRDWMTHCSLQSKYIRRTSEWQATYNLPVMIDEYGYEGDIEFDWGNLSAQEMVHRAWIIITGGGFITHGETFYREDEVLWWAKGGKLYGQCPERLAFLKALQYEIGDVETFTQTFFHNPNEKPEENEQEPKDNFASLFGGIMRSLPEFERRCFMMQFASNIVHNENYRLQYFGRQCPSRMEIKLPDNGKYKLEVIDTWEMTRTTVESEAAGNVHIKMPGKQGIAVLATRLR